MNLIYGKAVGFFGNSKEHFDYVKEENFLQTGRLSASRETICFLELFNHTQFCKYIHKL